MSESDDTDVLLLIPPDLFLVPSSESDEGSDYSYKNNKSGVITEILEHVQSLENRIEAIESKDNSLDNTSLLNHSSFLDLHASTSLSKLKGTRNSISQSTSLQNSPVKARECLSVPSTPHDSHDYHTARKLTTNQTREDARDSVCLGTNSINSKHADVINFNSASLMNSGKMFANINNSPSSDRKYHHFLNSPKKLGKFYTDTKIVKDMELSEVDELLQEMEATEIALAKRIGNNSYRHDGSPLNLNDTNFNLGNIRNREREYLSTKKSSPVRKLNYESFYKDMVQTVPALTNNEASRVPKESVVEEEASSNAIARDILEQPKTSLREVAEKKSSSEIFKIPAVPDQKDAVAKQESFFIPIQRDLRNSSTNTEPYLSSQRLLTLSDFWEENPSKSQEEMLRIRLEEEKFRREHCEHLIQELQKRLLEQQEKVAVAIRVDNEKNVVLSQFQIAWKKMKEENLRLENSNKELQKNVQSMTDKHREEVQEFQSQLKRSENELSKALDLAAGYKEKSDSVVKEKLEMLNTHASELENYKSLIDNAECRYDSMKTEYNKLHEKFQEQENSLKNCQQDLNKERLKGGEIRNEMAVIHKALDACEAELTVLRQEKESLQLKLKEEQNRNSILEDRKLSFLASIDEAKKAEKQAKEEAKSLAEQQDKIRAELREVYQKQVDDVVKTKLEEFQAQLDAAETAFQAELDTRQRAIAECAARKIKAVIEKHQLEINLLEEKHKEEKKLCELQLGQAMQRSSMLEIQLNTQRTSKSQLAEQLHSVMQKQWQQALQIISGSGTQLAPNELKTPRRSISLSNCYNKGFAEPIRLDEETRKLQNLQKQQQQHKDESLLTSTSQDETPLTSKKDSKSDDLRSYVKMILDMQQQQQQQQQQQRQTQADDFKCLSPPIIREVPRKHYTKKEFSIVSEDSVSWQPMEEEQSIHDTSEYLPIVQKMTEKETTQRMKPPWK